MNDQLGLDVEGGLSAIRSALASTADPQGRIHIDPETIEQDLARLLLGLMEFVRELMELQAVRRCENGSLTVDEEERLGLALMRAERAIHDMAAKFDLTPNDLSLNLGPLGRTT